LPRRIQSPSSINTFKQCPRKYYYQYIEKLPSADNIYTVRGKIAHSVLEKFFDLNLEGVDETNFIENFTMHLKKLFVQEWGHERNGNLEALEMDPAEIEQYKEETIIMLANWLNNTVVKIRTHMDNGLSFHDAFDKIKPTMVEQLFTSDKHQVRGFIDYIEEVDGEVRVMDFKTSKKAEVSAGYKLQLAIYALLYEEKFGKKPHKAGLWFLKHMDGEKIIDVDDALVKHAAFEIEQIHFATESSSMVDYKKNITPLCKWRTGQCTFYDVCYGHMTAEDFKAKSKK